MLLLATAAGVALLVVACVAKVHASSAANGPQHRIAVVTPLGTGVNAPGAAAGQPNTDFDGLQSRVQQAAAGAAADGATISVAVLDRATGQMVSNAPAHTIATASVAKLFIADDLLLQESDGAAKLSSDDRAALDVMLRSSDDSAAETFWSQGGGNAIIARVADRYGLQSTGPGSDGRWWNTISTAADLVRYYDMLLDGSGGLPPERANVIMADLARSTPVGIDGYPQRFGIPDGLYAESVAVKQGWMCCIGADWMHLSTGVVGADRRYVVVIESLQPSDEATARQTITQAVKAMFPDGRIT
jgi:hypothetical protein